MSYDPTHHSPSLPVELYRPITSFVDQRCDLVNLCLASKTLHKEVIPYLYNFVSLSTRNLEWCNTIIEKPFLGAFVHSLSINFVAMRRSDIRYFLGRVALSLHNLFNLEALAISKGEGCQITAREILPAFAACSLDIRQFDFQIPGPHEKDIASLFIFLERRPTITGFRCYPYIHALRLPQYPIIPESRFAAHLSHLSCSVEFFVGFTVLPPRALESLQVSCRHTTELELVLSALARVEKTLRKLCLIHSTSNPFSVDVHPNVLVGRIAEVTRFYLKHILITVADIYQKA
ncbi:hypothetical protein JAAARDRAFT_637691 [Jaapia argillacea MUCL 33604]|uniref:F-box domain-containing protein n=1 Tax=Jaapia argillacea MUCL 33604 TaxID=933084 RepID=A0A067Q1G0_9AGAM|nr:hypothetical protein JAAARDRAFT_637691 [Jaapia argillacea MUCL 33604]